jgi:multiple sugar transport system permease protein
MWGYIFLSPWVLGLLLFVAGPVIASAYFSLTDYDIISPPRFIGLANYYKAFFEDDLFWSSLGRTAYYSIVSIPLGVIGSLLFAILLNQRIPFTNLFRSLYFLPHLTPSVAMAIVWSWLLHPEAGPINLVLKGIGLPQPGWLTKREWAIPSIILISLWAGWGGNRMLIFLAGLQGVPDELYDASKVDGAGAWRRFLHVTLPMISPTMLFNLVLGVIGALQVFSLAFIATAGGPAYATWFFALHLYRQAFEYHRMGYGSALAWVFAFILVTLTLIQLRLSGRWVFYAGA